MCQLLQCTHFMENILSVNLQDKTKKEKMAEIIRRDVEINFEIFIQSIF